MMGTSQAAEALGTTSKLLRKFLRDHPRYGSVGNGGRYDFDGEQLEVLRSDFVSWRGSREMVPKTRKRDYSVPELAYLDEDPGVDVHTMNRAQRDPRLRAQLNAKRGARWHKLATRMREVGVTK